MEDRKLRDRLLAYIPWLVWLCFIFCNSLRSAEASSGQSSSVLAVLKPLLEGVGLESETLHTLLRKLAHFIEFFVLGALMTLRRRARWPQWLGDIRTILLGGLLFALTDETLQLLSPGRSAQVTDVWIDFAGFALCVLLCALCGSLRARRKNGRRRKRGKASP